MLYLVLGIIIGLILALIVFFSIRHYQVPIERTVKQVENKMKEKGEVFTPDEKIDDLEAYLNSLPKE